MSTDALAQPLRDTQPTLWTEIRRLISLAVPIVVSLAAGTLVWVVDTIMIAPLGTVPLAGVSLTGGFIIVFYSALYGYVSVIGVRMAEAEGEGSAEALSSATRTGLLLAACVGLIGTVLMIAVKPVLALMGQPEDVRAVISGYWIAMSFGLIPFTVFYALKGLFDAINAPWIGVVLGFLMIAVNVPANYLLIYGVGGWDGLGLLGAGLASILSFCVPLALAWAIWQRAAMTERARRAVGRSRAELMTQLREGSAIAIGYVGEGGAYAFAGLMLGWFSAAALAANQIVTSVSGVLYMVPLGVSIAVSIRIGQAIGAGARARLRRIGLAALLVIVAWMSVVMALVLVAGGWVSRSLSSDAEVVALATSFFVIVAAMQIADGVQGTMLGAARGMMDNRVPVALTLFSYWIVALPLGYALAFIFNVGPKGIWIGYGIGLALAAILVTRRFFGQARRA
ncbi:MAG: MATE family efflux transporter [Pseudomonadota bacterium]